jgi:hypothetical protein
MSEIIVPDQNIEERTTGWRAAHTVPFILNRGAKPPPHDDTPHKRRATDFELG